MHINPYFIIAWIICGIIGYGLYLGMMRGMYPDGDRRAQLHNAVTVAALGILGLLATLQIMAARKASIPSRKVFYGFVWR